MDLWLFLLRIILEPLSPTQIDLVMGQDNSKYLFFSDVDYYESLLCLEAFQMCTSLVLQTSVTKVTSLNPQHLIGRLEMRLMMHDGNTLFKSKNGPLEFVRITFMPAVDNHKRMIQVFAR